MPVSVRLSSAPILVLLCLVSRERQGFGKPLGFCRGVWEGRGQGTDIVTPHKPLPVAGVMGVAGVLEGYW
jgi:hypothetical protein